MEIKKHYWVVLAHTRDDLVQHVEIWLNEGYGPIGGVSVMIDKNGDFYYSQALYRAKVKGAE